MAVVATVESDFSLRKLKIAGVCLMGQLFGTSMLIVGPLSMLMLPMTQEFGWSRSQFSYSTAAVMWAGALAAPILGRLIDRKGVRPIVLTGTGVLGLLSLVLAHQTASLWLFYLLYALVGAFGAIGIGYGKVMGALFTQHRGKAMAFVGAFSPIIASVFPQISNQLLLAFGWRGIFTGYGIIILVAGVLLYFLLEEPASGPASAMPMRSAEGKDAQQPGFAPQMEGMTTAEALRGRTLWIMIGSGLVAGILGGGWYQHSFAFQLSRGFGQQMVVNALTFSLLIAPIATMFGGWLVDKVQTAKVYSPFALMAALSVYFQLIMSANHGGVPLLFVAVTLSTMAINVQMPMAGYFYTRFFGMKAYGEIAGINMAVLSLVAGFSAPLIGNLYERAGSYDTALLGMIVGYGLSALLYLAIGRYRYTTDFKKMAAQ
jgi:predicted MFS family arabinose efflux permease